MYSFTNSISINSWCHCLQQSSNPLAGYSRTFMNKCLLDHVLCSPRDKLHCTILLPPKAFIQTPLTLCDLLYPFLLPKNVTLERMSVPFLRGGKLSKCMKSTVQDDNFMKTVIYFSPCCVPNMENNCLAYNRCFFKIVD